MPSVSSDSDFDVSFDHGRDLVYPGDISNDTIQRVNHISQKEIHAEPTSEKNEANRRVKELEAQLEKYMGDLKRKLEGHLDNMRETTKRFMTEVGSHAQTTHSVLHRYEQIFESQAAETQRLEEVSQNVNSATSLPFLTSSRTREATAKTS